MLSIVAGGMEEVEHTGGDVLAEPVMPVERRAPAEPVPLRIARRPDAGGVPAQFAAGETIAGAAHATDLIDR
jgi:hypothetical protein